MADLSQRDLYLLVNLRQRPLWLTGVNLAGARMHRIDLTEADLWHSNLSGADLTMANLNSAHLDHADLSGADLAGADLSHASLVQADLRGANLEGTALGSAHYDSTSRWPKDFDPAEAGATLADGHRRH